MSARSHHVYWRYDRSIQGRTQCDRAKLLAAQAHCRTFVELQVPKTWTVVDVLPTSPVGKIEKAAVCQIVTNPQPSARELTGSQSYIDPTSCSTKPFSLEGSVMIILLS